MNIWKITVSGEISGKLNEYYGCEEKATTAMAKALALAKKEFTDDELYVSEVTFVSHKDF